MSAVFRHRPSGGTLSLTQTETADLKRRDGDSGQPDGSSVYVLDGAGGNITEFNRASDGSLTAKSTPTIASNESGYGDIAMDAGRYEPVRFQYRRLGHRRVQRGERRRIVGQIRAECRGGSDDYALIVSPNGRNVYASDCDGGLIYQFSIGSNARVESACSALGNPRRLPHRLLDDGRWSAPVHTQLRPRVRRPVRRLVDRRADTKSPATAAAGSGHWR